MKKIILILLTILSISTTGITYTNIHAKDDNTCNTDDAVIVKHYENEDGEEIKLYNDGVEVTYQKDGVIVLRDYKNHFDAKPPVIQTPSTRVVPYLWIKIGMAVWTGISACGNIYYVTDGRVDVCRVVARMLGTTRKPNAKYELTGKFIPGRIPGCEPIHSGPCNRGYWEYRVVKL